MRWTVTRTALADTAGDLLVYPVFQKNDEADLKLLMKDTRGLDGGGPGLKKLILKSGFSGRAESLFPVPCQGVKAGWILLAGLGKAEEAGLETLRKVAGLAAKRARAMKAARVLVQVPAPGALGFDDRTIARCWVEGAELALAPIGELKTGGKKKPVLPRQGKFLADGRRARALREGAAEAEAFAAGCLFARHLVNLPPNILTPKDLAARARRMARAEGLTCRVLNVPQMKKLKMGGILGVGQGSRQEPRLIDLQYRVPGAAGRKAPTVALVGKGITFDSGGISLKPGAGMELMKSDMGGAAAVLGAGLIAARLKFPVNLRVIIPTAENMPDGLAVKPADVITTASGKTVEVLNTDAEGRLILADALWYADRDKPDYIIDAATLTGACVVALGSHFAGLMSNSGDLIDALKQAGGETFERVWHLPLVDEHKKEVEGTWSDLQNLGKGREGGALTAAAFLSHFVGDETAWAHLDIAGPAWATGARATGPKGATGFGARLMARALQILVS
ncbi:MAG: leucyl aminopeptidase [Candidatus Krumholzibacteriota bacterium]